MTRLPWRAVCFDIGGTLVKMGRGPLAQEISTLLAVDRRAIRDLLVDHGKRSPTDAGTLAAAVAHGCGHPEATGAIAALLARRSVEWARPRLYHDVLPVLPELRRRGYRIFFLSNAVGLSAGQPDPGFFAFADAAFLSYQTGYVKPELAAFRAVEASTGFMPSQLVHVGDVLDTDVAGALQAGWSAVHLDRPKLRGGPLDAGHHAPSSATIHITSLLALLDLLPGGGPAPADQSAGGRQEQ